MNLTNDAKKLIALLLENGYKAYAVGGCVRDSILGRPIGDIDITTSATPQKLEELLEKNHIAFHETGIRHGTVTALLHHTPYEITTFRKDGDYLDYRRPSAVTFVDDLYEDLARRDFTINALAYNETEGLIDAFGGQEDIQRKTIRAVGNADKRFQEDALRMMRALRFAAVLGFTIAAETEEAIFRNKELLRNIASERIYTEVAKLLLGCDAERVLLEYREVLAVIIPEMAPCFDYPQNSKWHIYDVYTHIVKTVAAAPKKEEVRLALLLHDIGKPFCKTTDENGQDHFKGHPVKSAELAQGILKRFKVSNALSRKVVTLVEIHDLYITKKPSNIKGWLRRLGEEMTFDFIDVKIADMKTHNLTLAGEELNTLREIRRLTQDVIDSGEPYRITDLAINGNDLVALGFHGHAIADELEKLVKIVSGDANCNTREKLLRQAQKDKKAVSI